MVRYKETIKENIENQNPKHYATSKGIKVGEEAMTRALVAINNLAVIQAELLLEIREVLRDIDINTSS